MIFLEGYIMNYSTENDCNNNVATMTNKFDVLGNVSTLEEMEKFTPNVYDDIFIFAPKDKHPVVPEEVETEMLEAAIEPEEVVAEEAIPEAEETVAVAEEPIVEEEPVKEVQPAVDPKIAAPLIGNIIVEPKVEVNIVFSGEKPMVSVSKKVDDQPAEEIISQELPVAVPVEEVKAVAPAPVVIPDDDGLEVIEIVDAQFKYSLDAPEEEQIQEPLEEEIVEEGQEEVIEEPVEEPVQEEVVEEVQEEIIEEPVEEEVVEEIVEEPIEEIVEEEIVEEVQEEVVEEPVEEPVQEEVIEEEEEVVATEDDDSNNIIVAPIIIPTSNDEEEVEEEPIEDENKPVMAVQIDSNTEEDAEMLKERYRTVPMEKRLERASESARYYYSELKNELLSYQDTKSRTSKKFDTISIGRFTVAKITIKNDVVKLYLALVSDSLDTKYYTSDVSNSEMYDQTPTLHNVKSKRGLKYGIELIREIMAGIGYEKNPNYEPVDFAKELGPKDISEKKKQIEHLFKDQATPEDASLMTNDVAYDFLEIIKSDDYTINKFNPVNKFRIFTDDLNKTFEAGERVTIAALQEKGILPQVDNIFLEVKGRGVLDRKLIVEAHSFDMVSIKMILLLDGEVIQYK